jgi:peptidoglycan/xylan/chitin deacetylase (PgdA/CDA1 family)
MADVGRVRTFATLTAVLIAASASTTAYPSPASITSQTLTVSAHARATRASVASRASDRTIYLTFDGLSPSRTPAIPTLPVAAALARATSKTSTKTIYLTFDDGPNPTWTPEILSLLEAYGAHASFFVVGENAKKWPGLVEQEARDGDTVGDHTWSHASLTNVSASAAYVELGRDRNLVTTLTGQTPTLWRPPYEAFNSSVVGIASGLGMKMQLWTVDTGDWQLPGTEVIVLRVMAALHNGMVVLLHDGGGYTRSETVAAVAILIPELEAAGYRLAALPPDGIGR